MVHARHLLESKFKILENITKIDYNQKWNSAVSSFDIELSFTWLDWRIIEQLIQDESFNLENVETEQKI